MTEHDHQALVIRWAQIQSEDMPELDLLYATPNGGKRHIGVARKLKAEGVCAGVPDLTLPCARQGYHGLYIEMKAEKGTVSKPQKEWIAKLKAEGYRVEVCYGFESAIKVLQDYLS